MTIKDFYTKNKAVIFIIGTAIIGKLTEKIFDAIVNQVNINVLNLFWRFLQTPYTFSLIFVAFIVSILISLPVYVRKKNKKEIATLNELVIEWKEKYSWMEGISKRHEEIAKTNSIAIGERDQELGKLKIKIEELEKMLMTVPPIKFSKTSPVEVKDDWERDYETFVKKVDPANYKAAIYDCRINVPLSWDYQEFVGFYESLGLIRHKNMNNYTVTEKGTYFYKKICAKHH